MEDLEQRQRRSCNQLPDTVVRRNRGDRGELRSSGLQSANETEQVFGQSIGVRRLYVLENPGGLRMAHNDVQGAALFLMSPHQILIVVNGGAYSKPAQQAQASTSVHPTTQVPGRAPP